MQTSTPHPAPGTPLPTAAQALPAPTAHTWLYQLAQHTGLCAAPQPVNYRDTPPHDLDQRIRLIGEW